MVIHSLPLALKAKICQKPGWKLVLQFGTSPSAGLMTVVLNVYGNTGNDKDSVLSLSVIFRTVLIVTPSFL